MSKTLTEEKKTEESVCGFTILFVKHCYNEEFYSREQISSSHVLGTSFVQFFFLCFL